jgi:hypothetical protein
LTRDGKKKEMEDAKGLDAPELSEDIRDVSNAIVVNSANKTMVVRIAVHNARGLVSLQQDRKKDYRKSFSAALSSLSKSKKDTRKSVSITNLQKEIEDFDLHSNYGVLATPYSQMDELSVATDDMTDLDLMTMEVPAPEQPEQTNFDKLKQKPLNHCE